MIPKLREEDPTTKQKGNTIDGRSSKASAIPSTSWSMLRDSRVVRVSRAVGGKDRHSKVCTVRGLRDRRIRLSVPTAIQLYDLQDRLGLNQPSKVVDWLLDVAKHEIDELPPLQIPLGCFGFGHHQQLLTCHDDQAGINSQSEKSDRLKMNSNFMNWEDSLVIPKPSFWNFDPALKDKYKEISMNTGDDEGEKNGATVSSINFFPGANHSSLLNNPNLHSSFYRLDNPSLPVPQMRREDLDNLNIVPLPPTQPNFPSHVATSLECDPQQINHFHRLSGSSTSENPISNALLTPTFYSIGQPTRPLHLSMGPKLFGSEDNNGI